MSSGIHHEGTEVTEKRFSFSIAPWLNNDQLSIAVISAAILLAAVISSASTNAVSVFGLAIPPICPFKLLSSLDCPGCGLTRALVLAVHGRWSESYAMHIWGIPLGFLLLSQIPYRLYQYLRRPHPVRSILNPTVKKWINLAIFLSFLMPWIAKTIAVALLRYL